MLKINEINQAAIAGMLEYNIEPTLDNRLTFVTGIRDAWFEDETRSFEKSKYIIAINVLIISLKARIAFAKK